MKVRRFFLRLLPRLGIFVLSVLLLSVLTFYIPCPRSTPAGSAARCTAISASPINTRWTCWS